VRAVFLILLSANLLFLAWAKWIDSPRDTGNQDPLSHLPRLQLVTEQATPKPTSGIAQKMSYQIPDPTAAAAAATCTTIGPFSDITSAARAAGVLNKSGFHLQQRAEEGETIEGYWVFVGGAQTDDEVAQLVARLEMSGYADAHVMKNFSTNRRVSVGMFSTRDRAEKRAAAIKSMGLQSEIGERRFPGTVYWVDVIHGKGDPTLPPEYSFAEVGHSKVVMQSCPPAARPPVPDRSEPADDGNGIIHSLPRTTVASAPKAVP
jgi:cell division septation protein DedD